MAGLNNFGDDYIAGGPDADTIFGQLGNDVIQGDGSVLGKIDDGLPVAATRDEVLTGGTIVQVGTLSVRASVKATATVTTISKATAAAT